VKRYSRLDILNWLKAQVKGRKHKEYAASIGYLESNLSEVLAGKRAISDGLAEKLGFTKTPDSFTKSKALSK
jgi:plasmid maintenance system antidote protein VapI